MIHSAEVESLLSCRTNALFLTTTTQVGSIARILQHWLELGREQSLQGRIVVRPQSDFSRWGRAAGFSVLEDAMPWPSRRAPWTLWHAVRVAWWARQQGVNIVHCNEHDVYPFGQLVRRLLGLPVVCHVRYLLGREYAQWAFGGRRAPDALLWTSYQQKADSADAIAGLVPEERQHMVRLGVDLSTIDRHAEAGKQLRSSWGIAQDEVVVGLPSPFRPRKRVHEFLELLRRLASRHSQVVGIVAGGVVPGDEAYRDRIEREIRESGLGRRLRWVGYLDPVEPFHHACDISISTSEYETFGNSVCEAMACGTPVAAYRGGSVAEVVGESGLIVETGDLDGLTSAVDRLITDADLRSRLGAQAKQRVATEFNPAHSLKQLQAIYDSLLNTRNSYDGCSHRIGIPNVKAGS